MKKQYVAPQVEKIEFNYAETVVASPSGLWRYYEDAVTIPNCGKTYRYTWEGNVSDDGVCQKIIEQEYLN